MDVGRFSIYSNTHLLKGDNVHKRYCSRVLDEKWIPCLFPKKSHVTLVYFHVLNGQLQFSKKRYKRNQLKIM